MIARHKNYNKKILSIVLILVTALLISGMVVYTQMLKAKATLLETALVADENEPFIETKP